MGAIVVSLIFLPHILIGLPVVLVIFYYIRLYYVTTSRQIKRLEAVTRSPIYSNIPNTLEGLAVIRTFRSTDRFLNEFINVINTNTRMNFAFLSAGRWVGLRLGKKNERKYLKYVVFYRFLGISFFNNYNLCWSLS